MSGHDVELVSEKAERNANLGDVLLLQVVRRAQWLRVRSLHRLALSCGRPLRWSVRPNGTIETLMTFG